jgi:Zn-dependent peptidase ImmA (M78 family)
MTKIEENKIVERFQHSVPVDVTGLAEALGIAVWEDEELPENVSGKICQDENSGPSGYSILVRASDPYVRKRFTVAHEIAHFLLHRDRIGSSLTDDEMYRSGLSIHEEVAANNLAADILMPRPLLAEHIEKWGTNVPVLAQIFKVSEAAMPIRLGLK